MIDMPTQGQPVVTKAAWYRIRTIAGDTSEFTEEEKRWDYLNELLKKATLTENKKELYREYDEDERVSRGGHGIPVYTVTRSYDRVGVTLTLAEPITAEDWEYLKEAITYLDDNEIAVEQDRKISDRQYELGDDMKTITVSYETEEPYNSPD